MWGRELGDVFVEVLESDTMAMAMSAIKPNRMGPSSANTRSNARIAEGTFVSGLDTTAVVGRRGFVALASSKAVARKAQLCASQ